jgi:hypothetical protein
MTVGQKKRLHGMYQWHCYITYAGGDFIFDGKVNNREAGH